MQCGNIWPSGKTNVNAAGTNGETAFLQAVARGQMDAVRLLHKYGSISYPFFVYILYYSYITVTAWDNILPRLESNLLKCQVLYELSYSGLTDLGGGVITFV